MDAREMGIKGGKARAARLSPEERKKIAVKAGKASQAAQRKKKREAKKAQTLKTLAAKNNE
jgi:hypothetical protein